MRKILTLGAVALATVATAPAPALAQDAYIGQVKAFGFNYCPRGWISASGQLLTTFDYPTLFALYGPIYGGNGNSTFAVPDLNGRFAGGVGTGPGLTPRGLGSEYGFSQRQILEDQMPPHSHSFNASTTQAFSEDPQLLVLGSFAGVQAYAAAGPATVAMHPNTIAQEGGGQPIYTQDPFLALHYCVNVDGIFPPRP